MIHGITILMPQALWTSTETGYVAGHYLEKGKVFMGEKLMSSKTSFRKCLLDGSMKIVHNMSHSDELTSPFHAFFTSYCDKCVEQKFGPPLALWIQKFSKSHMSSSADCLNCSKELVRTFPDALQVSSLCMHAFETTQRLRRFSIPTLICSQLFDTILGLSTLFFFTIFLQNCHLNENNIRQEFSTFFEMVIYALDDLITWLMGAPAGLKVNATLSWILGQFYLYHIILWKNFIQYILLPNWHWLVISIKFFCFFGLSCVLCAMCDLFKLLTLHLTCFYSYSCKLFGLQVHIMQSLLQLFRGRKWNPLRGRVDTAPRDRVQFFTSTIYLAIVVFLLPTTASFYCVFSSIRLVFLFICGVANHMARIISEAPVLSVLLWCTNRPAMKDQITFTFPYVDKSVAHLQFCCSEFPQMYRVCALRVSPPRNSVKRYEWKQVPLLLLSGTIL